MKSEIEDLTNGNKFIKETEKAKQMSKNLERLYNNEKKKNNKLNGELSTLKTLLIKGNLRILLKKN